MLLLAITKGALVNVLVASRAGVARRAGADRHAIDRVGVTVGSFLTRITDACIIQMTQQTYNRRVNKQQNTTVPTICSCTLNA